MLLKDLSLRPESVFQVAPVFFPVLKEGELSYLAGQLGLSSQEIAFLQSQLSDQNLRLTPEQTQDLQTLIHFLAPCDIASLTQESLRTAYHIDQADLIFVLGNPSLEVAEAAAQAFHNGLANCIMVAGGVGHGTIFLRRAVAMNPKYAHIPTLNRSEAEIIKDVLLVNHVPVDAMLLETKSTNSSENAENALTILQNMNIPIPKHVILMQDPALQKRAHAVFEKKWNENRGLQSQFINYSGFVPNIQNEKTKRFFALIAGEMQRIQPTGYGPQGKKFIGYVEIPSSVQAAYERLKPVLGAFERA